METQRFSIYQAFRDAFQKIIDNFGLIAKVTLAYFVSILALTVLIGAINFSWLQPLFQNISDNSTSTAENLEILKHHWLLLLNSGIASYAFLGFIGLGYDQYILNLHDTRPAHITDLFPPLGKFLKYVCAYLVYLVIVAGGLVLLIVPGLYFMLRLMFFPFAILSQDAGIIKSLSISWQATKEYGWQLFGLMLLLLIVGSLLNATGIGFMVYAPFAVLAKVCTYRQLTSNHLAELERTIPQA